MSARAGAWLVAVAGVVLVAAGAGYHAPAQPPLPQKAADDHSGKKAKVEPPGAQPPLEARLRALSEAWPDPTQYSPEISAARARFLLKRHDVTEDEALGVLRLTWKDSHVWQVLLLGGTDRVETEFARRFFAPDDGNTLERSGCASGATSPELTRALLPYLKDLDGRDERHRRAVELIAEHATEEVVPVLRAAVLRFSDFEMTCAAKGLGRVKSSASLAALEEAWFGREGSNHGYREALAEAIGAHGDAGVEALRRIAGIKKDCYIFSGLRRAASPAAVALAEELCDPTDINERWDLMRVKLAAGEPFRTRALVEAMEEEGQGFLSEALSRIDDLEPTAEIMTLVKRIALGTGVAAGRAQRTLSLWRYRRENGTGAVVAWGEPADGMVLGLIRADYRARDADTAWLECHVALKSIGVKALLVTDGHWQLVVPEGSELQALPREDPDYRRDFQFTEGSTVVSVAVKPVPFREGRPPLAFRLRREVRAEDYPNLAGWTGHLETPAIRVTVAPTLVQDPQDLAHWREFLSAGAREGSLPPTGVIAWSQHGGRVNGGLTVQGTQAAGRGAWLALPDDLLTLKPEEVKRLCEYLLEGDRFAHAVVMDAPPARNKYPPHAMLRVQSPTRWAEWRRYSFTEEASTGLDQLEQEFLAPRLAEARRRLLAQ